MGDWPSEEAFQAFKRDPTKFQAIMANAGVISQPAFEVMTLLQHHP